MLHFTDGASCECNLVRIGAASVPTGTISLSQYLLGNHLCFRDAYSHTKRVSHPIRTLSLVSGLLGGLNTFHTGLGLSWSTGHLRYSMLTSYSRPELTLVSMPFTSVSSLVPYLPASASFSAWVNNCTFFPRWRLSLLPAPCSLFALLLSPESFHYMYIITTIHTMHFRVFHTS